MTMVFSYFTYSIPKLILKRIQESSDLRRRRQLFYRPVKYVILFKKISSFLFKF